MFTEGILNSQSSIWLARAARNYKALTALEASVHAERLLSRVTHTIH